MLLGMTNLTRLALEDNRLALDTTAEQRALGTFASLRTLLLGSNRITHLMPSALPASLKELQLFKNELTAVDDDMFTSHCCLSRLSLFGNKIESVGTAPLYGTFVRHLCTAPLYGTFVRHLCPTPLRPFETTFSIIMG